MEELKKLIKSYPDFPKKGILFRDVLNVLKKPEEFENLISKMSSSKIINNAEAIVAIDARGFIFGSAIALYKKKPMIVARKPGKLPGNLITEEYNLEYGTNSLSIQLESIEEFDSFVIVDDLLATGGTAMSVYKLLKSLNKEILGLSVVIELKDLDARKNIPFHIESQINF